MKGEGEGGHEKLPEGKIFGETTVEVSDFVCEQLAEHIERVSQEATQEFDKKEQGKIVVKDKNEEQPAKSSSPRRRKAHHPMTGHRST